jgi:hypothetical protein
MDCEYIDRCGFLINLDKSDPFTTAMIRRMYCESECEKYDCVRYILAQMIKEEDIPDYLWPNEEIEALEIIKALFPA